MTTKLTIKNKPFFYDRQIPRYLAQVMGCFAGYQVITGKVEDGKPRFLNVPVIHGDQSRVSAWILHGGNENAMSPLPIMAVDMIRLRQDESLRRVPSGYEILYLPRSDGRRDTVERFMPVPYDMGIRVSAWCSNNDQILQIVEQIGSVFNPSLPITISNAPCDWTFRTDIKFDGEFSMGRSSSDPGSGGGEDGLYVVSMDFTLPIHLGVPVKVYQGHNVEEIHVNLLEMAGQVNFEDMESIDELIITAD